MQRRQPAKEQRGLSSTGDNPVSTAHRRLGRKNLGLGSPSCFRVGISFVLHVLGAALGIYQLGQLYGVLNPELGAVGVGVGVGVAPEGDTSHRPGRATGRSADAVQHDNKQRQPTHTAPENNAETAADAAATLFPPFIFYTAANLTKAAEQDKEGATFRSHCRDLNPTYEIRAYDDEMSRNFVANHFPEWLALFDNLDVPVMRADMWRYLILYHFGGVYFDSDVDCKRPIDEWGEVLGVTKDDPDRAARLGAMVGIEYRRPAHGVDHAVYPNRLQFAQWTMAGQPRHRIYYRTVEMINETIHRIRAGDTPPGDAVYITGPVMFSRAIIEFMVEKGRLTWDQVVKAPGNNDVLVNDSSITEETDILVGDLAILHENAFAYRGRNRGAAKSENHPTVYARHWYRGGWKPDGWKKKSDKFKLFKSTRINAVQDDTKNLILADVVVTS